MDSLYYYPMDKFGSAPSPLSTPPRLVSANASASPGQSVTVLGYDSSPTSSSLTSSPVLPSSGTPSPLVSTPVLLDNPVLNPTSEYEANEDQPPMCLLGAFDPQSFSFGDLDPLNFDPLTLDPNEVWNCDEEASGTGPTRRKKRVPRPPNAFMLFRAKLVNERLPAELPNRQQMVSVVAGQAWHVLDNQRKDRWKELARTIQTLHMEKYPDYKFSPTRKSNSAKGGDQDSTTPPGKTPEEYQRHLRETYLHIIGPAVTPTRARKAKSKKTKKTQGSKIALPSLPPPSPPSSSPPSRRLASPAPSLPSNDVPPIARQTTFPSSSASQPEPLFTSFNWTTFPSVEAEVQPTSASDCAVFENLLSPIGNEKCPSSLPSTWNTALDYSTMDSQQLESILASDMLSLLPPITRGRGLPAPPVLDHLQGFQGLDNSQFGLGDFAPEASMMSAYGYNIPNEVKETFGIKASL
ncbi:hypothetical protein NLI96_g10152 [Meripilus lineatus]|uniref:HMG box domain-containing protein n=1 Tax=Meripilus lineatus TaxID=2056292 RepID=A0AAD5YEK8_9APHY|nr:hypothetical protein NLI96_g10152 [Physisporinus lineatus]